MSTDHASLILGEKINFLPKDFSFQNQKKVILLIKPSKVKLIIWVVWKVWLVGIIQAYLSTIVREILLVFSFFLLQKKNFFQFLIFLTQSFSNIIEEDVIIYLDKDAKNKI